MAAPAKLRAGAALPTPPLPEVTEEQTKFLETIVPPALASALAFDLPAAIIIAQAILESAGRVNGKWQWGGSPLFKNANNPFGIKLGHRQGSEAYEEYCCKTTEDWAGRPHEVSAEFQKFDNLKTAFNAHATLLLSVRYRPALAVRHDWRAYANAIMECGYSTDRPPLCKVEGCVHYAGKLIQLVEGHALDNIDFLRKRYFAPPEKILAPDVELAM